MIRELQQVKKEVNKEVIKVKEKAISGGVKEIFANVKADKYIKNGKLSTFQLMNDVKREIERLVREIDRKIK